VYESIRVSDSSSETAHVSVCLMFTDKTLHHFDQDFDALHERVISSAVKRADVRGENGELTVLLSAADVILALLGLGKRKEFNAEKARSAFGKLIKGLRKLEAPDVRISIPEEVLANIDAIATGASAPDRIA